MTLSTPNPLQESTILQGVKVFYIEDDAFNRNIVATLIKSCGGDIQFNNFGLSEIIVPKLRIYRPHLILMDLMLPAGMDGYSVTSALLRHESLRNVPIVALSSSDAALEIPRAIQAGMRGFIPKPVDSQTFPGYVRRIIDGEVLWLT